MTINTKSLPSRRVAYGLDGGAADVLTVVRAERTRHGIQCIPCVQSVARDSEAAKTLAMRIQAESLAGVAWLATAVPTAQSSTRWLTVPFPSLAKARKVLPSLLDVQLPFPLETCVYGFPVLRVGADGASVEALALTARHAHVDACAHDLEQAAWPVHVLDHEGLALWQAGFPAPDSGSEGVRVVTYLDAQRTVWVVGRGRQFLSVHAAATGAEECAHSEEARAAWVERVLRILRAQGLRPEEAFEWRWLGPAAQTAVLPLLEAACKHRMNPRFSTVEEPATALAGALAVRALTGTGWNFRVGETAHPQVQQARAHLRNRATWTTLAAGLTLMALQAGFSYAVRLHESRLDRVIAREATDLLGDVPLIRGQETLLATRVWEEERVQLAPLQRHLHAPPATAAMTDVLQAAHATGVRYHTVHLRTGHWTLNGQAPDRGASERLVDVLRTRTGLAVRLDRREVQEDGRILFQITVGGDA